MSSSQHPLIGFGSTVLTRGLNSSEVDGIGSYTQHLGFALESKGVSIIPQCFGSTLINKDQLFSRATLIAPAFAKNALQSAVTGFTFFDENILKNVGVELFHATDHLIPKYSNMPVVATIMDAIPLSNPEWIRTNFSWLKSRLWRHTAKWADHIITISDYSKLEIIKYFGVSDKHITVTPLGVDKGYYQDIPQDIIQMTLSRLGLKTNFFLCLGTLQPRKNIDRAILAHKKLPQDVREQFPLVVVGRQGWSCEDTIATLEDDCDKTIIWLKYLPQQDVICLMKQAVALVFISLSEGFGLPVIEAFAAGLPVITSNTTSLPEVAGDAALLVDPLDVTMISQAMYEVSTNSTLAKKLSSLGLERALQFNWQSTAQQTLDVYHQVLGA